MYYRGVKLDITVESYDTARAALMERARRARGFTEEDAERRCSIPLGHPRSDVTRVRLNRDDSIAFRLYATDVVTWHPDNSVSVEGYPTVTTAAFANCLLPRGLDMSTSNRSYECLIYFDRSCHSQPWWDRELCDATGHYYHTEEGGWAPDEDTLSDMSVYEIDRKLTRQISKEFRLKDFSTWIEIAPPHGNFRWVEENCGLAGDLAKQGKFAQAAGYLPAMDVPNGFGLSERMRDSRLQGVPSGHVVGPGSVERLRTWLYHEHGAITEETVKTMTSSNYERNRKTFRKLVNVGKEYE